MKADKKVFFAASCGLGRLKAGCFAHPFLAIFVNRPQNVIARRNFSRVNPKWPLFD
jgi:hypothetical protein